MTNRVKSLAVKRGHIMIGNSKFRGLFDRTLSLDVVPLIGSFTVTYLQINWNRALEKLSSLIIPYCRVFVLRTRKLLTIC